MKQYQEYIDAVIGHNIHQIEILLKFKTFETLAIDMAQRHGEPLEDKHRWALAEHIHEKLESARATKKTRAERLKEKIEEITDELWNLLNEGIPTDLGNELYGALGKAFLDGEAQVTEDAETKEVLGKKWNLAGAVTCPKCQNKKAYTKTGVICCGICNGETFDWDGKEIVNW